MRVAYSTDWTNQTVTIDYHPTLRLFLTDKEQRPFSAERIIQMLNHWAKVNKLESTAVGRLQIAADNARCVFTSNASNTLAHLYQSRHDWQIDYPFLSEVLLPVA